MRKVIMGFLTCRLSMGREEIMEAALLNPAEVDSVVALEVKGESCMSKGSASALSFPRALWSLFCWYGFEGVEQGFPRVLETERLQAWQRRIDNEFGDCAVFLPLFVLGYFR